MDFENFCNNEELKIKAEELKKNSNIDYDGLVNKYKNKSKNELFTELLSVAKEQKAKGNLSKEQLHNIYATLSPMLNEKEQENLKNLLSIIGE